MASERRLRRGGTQTEPVPDDIVEPTPAPVAAGQPDRVRTMTAGASRIRYDTASRRAKKMTQRQPWQTLSWRYFDDVPEVKNGVYLVGNIMAKVRWFVAVHPGDDPTAEPIAVSDPASGIDQAVAERAEAELARLRSDLGGQAEIVRALNMNLEVAGEGYIVGYGAIEATPDPLDPSKTVGGRPESWELRSVLEVVMRNGDAYVLGNEGDTQGVKLDLGTDDEPGHDTCIRIFQRHPAWASKADCALRGLLLDCEAVITLTNEVLADSRARHSAGLLKVPAGLVKYNDGLAEKDSSGDEAKTSPFLTDLDAALTDPVDDPGTAAAAAPTLVVGSIEDLKGLEHLKFGNDERARDIEAKINGRVERIARGLNLPPEKVMGHMQTTFANAGQIDSDEFDDYLEPRCLLAADGLTVAYLRPNLAEPAVAADGTQTAAVAQDVVDRMFVWFDASALIADPDLSGNALAAHGAGLITDDAARIALGWDTNDAPKPGEQLANVALQRGQINDVVLLAIASKLLGVDLGVDAASLAPAPAQPPAQPVAASGRRVTPLGQRLTAIDRELRARLLVAADRSMARVLEKAGNRLRGRHQFRDLVVDVPSSHVAAALGRAQIVAAGFDDGDLVGKFDDLHDLFMQWASTAGDQAIDELARAIGGFDVATRDALGLRQAQSLDEAWGWFEQSMVDLAGAKLYDPTVGLAEIGEATDLAVPAGLVREALARAGGVTALGDGAGAYVAVPTDGSAPSGIATGPIVMDAWRGSGGDVDGYVWDYGPAMRARPFHPHEELDGVTFATFDDDVLANNAGWPDAAYFIPGDHAGCICDVSPVMLSPAEQGAPIP